MVEGEASAFLVRSSGILYPCFSQDSRVERHAHASDLIRHAWVSSKGKASISDLPPTFFSSSGSGSVLMLLAILLILLQTGTTDLQISLTKEFSERRQIFLWIASFASFVVKVPMVPVHIWLLEAHVEAPTT
ncbi:NADH dehydrogenase subunit 4 [Cucumis melo var. makuwa]|uniref:NADH-ubiquinone oxidoreductase chain 4 n=1 Tax=Cucumis melo var. makuwa TaxID=1194695 RepID=A0A5A7U445_CUCMM|nr:NADH dehydrogenase subunit 4 [Cucumis melo var. makuwa]TYK10674.1 NADH dehydrogenase subunit 4 [Cucumis melo var. makuwa]